MKKNLKFLILVNLLVLICFNPSLFTLNAINDSEIFQLTSNDDTLPSADSYVKIPYLPVDIDEVFWVDNLTEQSRRLNQIGNGTGTWMLPPWGGCFSSMHIEGANKWYLQGERKQLVKMPIAGRLVEYQIENGTEVSYNGSDLIKDVRIFIEIGKDCAICIEHMDVLESLHNEFLANPSYMFTKDQFIGYTMTHSGPEGIEFYYLYKRQMVYPLPAFPQEYQDKITNYFEMQVDRAKIAGVYPESEMYYPMDKSEAYTLWGVWRYDSGPYDSYIEAANQWDDVQGSILTLYDIGLTDPETFHKDPMNKTKDLSDDIIGLLQDCGGTKPAGYMQKGFTLLEQVEGDETQGILKLRCLWYGDYDNETIYAKFTMNFRKDSTKDDLLTIEYFDTLIEAQAGFTGNEITYRRLFPDVRPPWNYIVMRRIIYMCVGGVVLLAVVITAVVIIIKRRKKKN